MKRIFVFILVLLELLVADVFAQQELKLWYQQPAVKWVEALPLGNGKIGAMIFGGVREDLIQMNEMTLWSGGPVKADINPMAAAHLPAIRKALLEDNDLSAADSLVRKMQGKFSESFLPLGDLVITQDLKDAEPTNYYRDLDLKTAVSTTSFTVGEIIFTRQYFINAPANVMVVRLQSSAKGALNLTIKGSSQLAVQSMAVGNNELKLYGKAPSHVDPSYYNPKGRVPVVYEDSNGCNGMRFQFNIHAQSTDGNIKTDSGGIHITGGSQVTLVIAAATSFNGFDKCPDRDGLNEDKLVRGFLDEALSAGYNNLLSGHKKDYQQYFKRVSLVLKDSVGTRRVAESQKNKTSPRFANTDDSRRGLPSDQRLKAYATGISDPDLESLYFQYGRYLLISCSRPGGQPANLQGIWNRELRAPWSSNYTININTEMNYWPAGPANLIEMQVPLNAWIGRLAVTGRRTAKEFYSLEGWVAHHNSDIWALTNPVGDVGTGDPVWANWYMGGNWLARHLWEYYLYTGDKKFLSDSAYPIMKSAAEFTSGWLVVDKSGTLVSAPSTSPENKFFDLKGKEQSVSVASTMDMSVSWDLFSNLVAAARVLRTDYNYRDSLTEKINKLSPLKIGSAGQLLEWSQEYRETDPKHRHVSHLYGLHPGHQITPLKNPRFADAAKKTLEIRGDAGTGWSKGWKINFWARLHDGNHAYKLIRELLQYVDVSGTNMTGGGTYPNFFDAHPPFQIDGNFAGTAGICEMLMQSHDGAIHILPALPTAWNSGTAKGLMARGGFEIAELSWKNGRITKLIIKSKFGGNCRIRVPHVLRSATVHLKPATGENANNFYTGSEAEKSFNGKSRLYDFNTKAGMSYVFVP